MDCEWVSTGWLGGWEVEEAAAEIAEVGVGADAAKTASAGAPSSMALLSAEPASEPAAALAFLAFSSARCLLACSRFSLSARICTKSVWFFISR